jgi:hypothetical protein
MTRSAPRSRCSGPPRWHGSRGGRSTGTRSSGPAIHVGGWGRTRRLVVLALADISLAVGFLGSAAASAQAVSHQPESQPSSIRPIPIPEIAQRAEEVATLLRPDPGQLAPEAGKIEDQLPALSDWVQERRARTTRVLASAPSPTALINLIESWQLMRSRLTAANGALAGEARALERRLAELEGVRSTWLASRSLAVVSAAPSAVLGRIDEILAAIAAAQERAGAERTRVLDLQQGLLREVTRCDDALLILEKARDESTGPLLRRDSPPIWHRETRLLTSSDLGARLRP